jgi:hypothetical protein
VEKYLTRLNKENIMRFFGPFSELLRTASGGQEILNGMYLGPLTLIEDRPSLNGQRQDVRKSHGSLLVFFVAPITFLSLLRLFGWKRD